MMKATPLPLASRLMLLLRLVIFAFALSGCASPVKEHFYQLRFSTTETHTEAVARTTQYDVMIDSVMIPEAINRPQLVVQKSATEAQILDEQRWVAPLDEQIRQALQANLQAQLPNAWLSQHPQGHPSAQHYVIRTEVRDLRITPSREVSMDVVWIIYGANRNPLKRQQRRVTAVLNDNDYATIAPAISTLLQDLSDNIAVDLRRLAEVQATP